MMLQFHAQFAMLTIRLQEKKKKKKLQLVNGVNLLWKSLREDKYRVLQCHFYSQFSLCN